ncbi:unnamed protein product, partial [Dovyalis caffra]
FEDIREEEGKDSTIFVKKNVGPKVKRPTYLPLGLKRKSQEKSERRKTSVKRSS